MKNYSALARSLFKLLLKMSRSFICVDGLQAKYFCYVDDMIEGFVRQLSSPEGITGPMNLGIPGEITMLDLAEKIRDLAGSCSALVRFSVDDFTQRQSEIKFLRKVMDWESKVPLSVGLRKAIDYFFDALLRDERR